MKKIFLLLSLSFLSFLPVTSITLTSCSQTSTIEKQTITLDFQNLTNSSNLSTYSKDDLISLLKYKDPNNSDFIEFLNLLDLENKINNDSSIDDSAISFQTIDLSKLDFYNFNDANIEINSEWTEDEKLANQSKVNISFNCSYNGNIYNIIIKNIYLFANSIFRPSYLFVGENSSQYKTFSQEDLGSISNISYKDITGSQWKEQINNYFLQANPKSDNWIIPDFGYIYDKGVLKTNNIYELHYIVNPIYKEQISKLANASQFGEIIINIQISPYAGKELKTSFVLETSDVKKFFNNATTFDEIINMQQIDIYNALNKYVSSLSTIQPLRDCLLSNSTNNTQVVNNYNMVTNEYSNPPTIVITFESITTPSYNYKFTLNFNN
ncbi:MAG: hypothetical protein K2N40_00805 [Ureaplasma sp.]|nr:hypothetical protein [Ureaplasma sp.]